MDSLTFIINCISFYAIVMCLIMPFARDIGDCLSKRHNQEVNIMSLMNENQNIITLEECAENAAHYADKMQQHADTFSASRDNLVIDLFAQSQRIEDAIVGLELQLDTNELGSEIIVPLPIQYVIANVRDSVDTLQDVLIAELTRRADTVDLDATIPALEEPLDFDVDECQFNDHLFDGNGELLWTVTTTF